MTKGNRLSTMDMHPVTSSRHTANPRDGTCLVVTEGTSTMPSLWPIAGAFGYESPSWVIEPGGGDWGAALDEELCRQPVALVLAEWPTDPRRLDALLDRLARLNASSVIVRSPERFASASQVTVCTNGGLHTVRRLWMADALAAFAGVPVRMAQVVAAGGDPEGATEVAKRTLTAHAHVCHVPADIRIVAARDVVQGLAGTVGADDVLVMGAPSHWRMAGRFGGTIPQRLAGSLTNPVAMLVAPLPARLDLADVLWESHILIDQPSGTSEDVIARLLDCLIATGQLPGDQRQELLATILAREAEMTTAVGGAVAMPHLAIPGFLGVTMAVAAIPDGVDFQAPDGLPVRLVCLFVTAAERYDYYLPVLARLAEWLLLPALREELVHCRSAAEARRLLTAPDLNPQ